MTTTKVGIIGTSGRQGLHQQLSEELFEDMLVRARQLIVDEWQLKPAQVELVSGGAAWADHVAVRLFASKEFAGLTLHLPTRWDPVTRRFTESNKTGQTANYYHRLFSDTLHIDSWAELQAAMTEGAKVLDHYDGFFDRNNGVTRVDYMMAFTLATGDAPPQRSGTHYTWARCRLPADKKRHLSLAPTK